MGQPSKCHWKPLGVGGSQYLLCSKTVIPPGTHPTAIDFEIGSLIIGPSPWAPEVNSLNLINRNQDYLLQEPLDGYWSILLFDKRSLRSAVAVKRRRGPLNCAQVSIP